jgi:hypothetical protein
VRAGKLAFQPGFDLEHSDILKSTGLDETTAHGGE